MRSDLLPRYYVASGCMLAVLLGLWSYFWAVFPVNDGLVGGMTEADWRALALGSAGRTMVRAGVVGLLGWAVGALAVRRRTDSADERRVGYRQAACTALACAIVVTGIGVAGSIHFLVERPIF